MTTTVLDPYTLVGQRLNRYQQTLAAKGTSLKQEIDERYLGKWRSEALYHVSRIRTSLVSGMIDHLSEEGLLNLERVSVSLVTDPASSATPAVRIAPGRRTRRFDPRDESCSSIACRAPCPRASMATTAPTPIRIPNIESAVRTLFAASAFNPWRKCSTTSAMWNQLLARGAPLPDGFSSATWRDLLRSSDWITPSRIRISR